MRECALMTNHVHASIKRVECDLPGDDAAVNDLVLREVSAQRDGFERSELGLVLRCDECYHRGCD